MRAYLTVLICLAILGCASTGFIHKTQRERDVEQCTYGVVIPDNIRPRDRSYYIKHEAVPACLRAKGYSEQEAYR